MKSFDSIPYHCLLLKLQGYIGCIDGELLRWIGNFLVNCQQKESLLTEWRNVLSGVCQGYLAMLLIVHHLCT